MAFIGKNWQKNASQNGVRALCRVAGAGVAAFALTKLTAKADTNANTTIKNISGPAAVVVGVMGDLMLEDDKLRSVCQGIYTYGALKSISVIAPSIGEPLGLNGLAGNGISGTGPVILNAVEPTTEQTTSERPEELIAIEQGADNDGNDWAKVAEYVDENAEDAISIESDNFELKGLAELAAKMN